VNAQPQVIESDRGMSAEHRIVLFETAIAAPQTKQVRAHVEGKSHEHGCSAEANRQEYEKDAQGASERPFLALPDVVSEVKRKSKKQHWKHKGQYCFQAKADRVG
jgi:hypothetical protein